MHKKTHAHIRTVIEQKKKRWIEIIPTRALSRTRTCTGR